MTGRAETSAVLASIEERLRPERETFDQRKSQDARWFSLRLTMGFIAALLLPVLAGIAIYVVLSHDEFPTGVVNWAGGVVFVDVVALLVAVWKLVLNPGSATRLEPVTVGRLPPEEPEAPG